MGANFEAFAFEKAWA